MVNPIRTSTLVQIAGGTFVLGSFGLWVSQKFLHNKVRDLPHFKESFNIVSKHEKALALLGKPIQVGQVDLSDRKNNFIGKDMSQLRIPISGKHNSGFLNVYAQRIISPEEVDSVENISSGLKVAKIGDFVTKSIELEMEDQTILIYEKKQ